MADRQLDDVFGLRPVPKRRKCDLTARRLREAYSCASDRICIYVLGPDDESVSKVGVSRTPYNRMRALGDWKGQELRMCYFAEVSRKEGFKVEAIYHHRRKERGEKVEGEWVCAPRDGITRDIRDIMAGCGIHPTREAGDTGETEDGEDASKGWRMPDGYAVPVSSSCKFKRG